MRFAFSSLAVLLCTAIGAAQLIPAGQPVPRGANPPVVFVNGYQTACTDSDFASSFGAADKLLQARSIVTLYFDNCSVIGIGPLRPSIEAEGAALAKFLNALKYTDGTAVTQVDMVAHSMGGLIVRSYLAGKQDVTPASFTPPLNPLIRKLVFLGTPHFGTSVAAIFGVDKQTQELSPGSQFLFDLNSWNDGTDDLRGIQAISVAGSGGTGLLSKTPGFDDGVVALTSSSLGFYGPGVTRVVPYCHTVNLLLTGFGACASSTPVLNILTTDPGNLVGQIVISFLTGTNAWQSIGQSAEANPLLSVTAGTQIQLRDQNDVPVQVIGASVTSSTPAVALSTNAGSGIASSDALPANSRLSLQITPLSGTIQSTVLTLPATTELPAVVKPGPMINPKGIVPAAGPAPFPFDVAPGSYVSIYGNNLASSSPATGAAQPYPLQIGDVQALVNGTPAPLQYAGAGQINIVFPNVAPGLAQVTVKNMNGQNTKSIRVAPAVPSIFLLDANSTAAALNGLTSAVVGPNTPLHAGYFLSLYVTGLGATVRMNGLDYAQLQPVITVGGINCSVSYAGRNPAFAALDQINCQIPVGVSGSAVPVSVNSNGRLSNTAFIAVQ
jgi:uncharacterized protein (TIGR03437 family)